MIGGLVLAAGGGTRFGTEPKLLADIDGRPVLQHAIETMTHVRDLERVVVVLGAHAELLLARVPFGRAEGVICSRWREGQSASLRCGVDALGGAEKIVVTLGDQPLVTPEMVERLIRAPAGSRATYRGKPGHPVVLGRQHLRQIEQLTGDEGARAILNGPSIETADLGIPRDVDTQKDLEEVRREVAASSGSLQEG